MKLIYALLCDSAFLSIDRKVNIIGVFETINAPSFPVTHAKFTLVGSIEPTKDRFKMAVNIVDEDRKLSVMNRAQEREVSLPTVRPGKNFNFIIEILNTTFPAKGNYLLEIMIDGEVVGTAPLTLALASEMSDFTAPQA